MSARTTTIRALLVLAAAAPACLPAGGEGAGGSGGAGTTGGSGGTDPGAGGGAGTGATGECRGPCLRGTVLVPEGAAVDGVQVFDCVPDASGAECDPARSAEITLAGGGRSAPFLFDDVADAVHYLIAGKDVNGNDAIDVGDLLGAAVDDTGAIAAFDPPASGIEIRLERIPEPSSSTPADLVGLWSTYGSVLSESFELKPDGTYLHVQVFSPNDQCVTISEIRNTDDGRIQVDGDRLTFIKGTAQRVVVDCSDEPRTTVASTAPITYRFRLEAGPSLRLTNLESGTETVYDRE